MKILIGVDFGSYTFNATEKTVTLNGLNPIELEQVLLITNVNTNTVIYQFNKVGYGGTIATNVITLDFNTSVMNNSDSLQIFIDYESTLATSAMQDSILTELKIKAGLTVFNEQQVALRTSQMNFKPTWGVTTYRYKTTTTGTGASAAETNGEFRLQTGTTTTNVSSIETNQRGQYQAGAMGQAGIGFRIPTNPVSTQYAKWGYSDFTNNGFYFGIDVTGLFVAYVTGGVETKVYQTNWNKDKLNGLGASGLTITPSNGGISQIDFTWYGYGNITFSFIIFNTTTLKTEKIAAHTIKINSSVSVIDPNQPLKFEVGNGASSTADFSLYIGGHQFSILDGFSIPQKRLISELISNYTTATNTNWQSILAFRKKTTFNSRTNSVNVILDDFQVSGDGEMETRITIGGTTSNLTWLTPTGITATETAIETKISGTGGTVLTTSVDGNPSDYGFVNATKTSSGSFQEKVDVLLGSDIEVILWVRRLSAVGAIVVKHAHVTWQEEW